MNLTVKGKNIDVGDALKSHVAESLDKIFGKYFGDPIESTVTFSKQKYFFVAQVSVHVGSRILLQSEAEAEQPYTAYDLAAEHLVRRLRRYKNKLRDHHRTEIKTLRAAQYVLAAGEEELPEASSEHNHEASPIIIAEMHTDIPMLSVSEAVMHFDLANHQAMLFLNKAHGGLNMIYRRQDGNIGWVDPGIKSDDSNTKK